MSDPKAQSDEPIEIPVEMLLQKLGVQAMGRVRIGNAPEPITVIHLDGGADVGDRIMQLLTNKNEVIDQMLRKPSQRIENDGR